MDESLPDESPKSRAETARRRLRGVAVFFAVVGGLFVLFVALHRPILRAVGSFLDVSEAPVPAGMIYLFAGDYSTRPFEAAKLWREGYAPYVGVAAEEDTPVTAIGLIPNGTEVAIQVLLREGVPDSAIVIVPSTERVTSTTDEADALGDYLRDHPMGTVILVTSRYHTRRARWNVKRQIPDASTRWVVVGVSDYRFDAESWWQSEAGMLAYFEEYLKFVHNWIYR